MDKKIEVSWLLDFYGQLLTNKQRQVMDMYFNEDVSLSEIAEGLGVSRQAVHDIIGRSETSLFEYENKLGLLKQFSFMSGKMKEISKRLKSCKTLEERDDICKEIDELITQWEE